MTLGLLTAAPALDGAAFVDSCATVGPDGAATILVLHSGDPFTPAAGALQPFPGKALAGAMAAAGHTARVIACDAGGADSGALLSQADRLLAELQPQAIVVVGLGADRFLNDPRQPWLPPAEDGQEASSVAGAWKERDHFVVFRPRMGERLYAFDGAAGPENWRRGVADTVLAPVGEGVWRLVTDKSRFHYQVMSAEIAVAPGQPLILTHDVQVSEGRLSLGVLDAVENRFIAREDLPEGAEGERRLEFASPSHRLRLILHNNRDPAGVSQAEIRGISLHEKDKRNGEGDPAFSDPSVMDFGRGNLRRLIQMLEASGVVWMIATHWTPLFALPEEAGRVVMARLRTGPVHTLRQAHLHSRIYDDLIRTEMAAWPDRLLDLRAAEAPTEELSALLVNRLLPMLGARKQGR